MLFSLVPGGPFMCAVLFGMLYCPLEPIVAFWTWLIICIPYLFRMQPEMRIRL